MRHKTSVFSYKTKTQFYNEFSWTEQFSPASFKYDKLLK